jgi:hypothetical protein
MSGLGDLPDEVIVAKFAVVAAIGAIGVQAVPDKTVIGPDDI